MDYITKTHYSDHQAPNGLSSITTPRAQLVANQSIIINRHYTPPPPPPTLQQQQTKIQIHAHAIMHFCSDALTHGPYFLL